MVYFVKLVYGQGPAVRVLRCSLDKGRQDVAVVEHVPPASDKVDPWCVVYPRTRAIGEEIKKATGWKDYMYEHRRILSIFAPCTWEELKKILNEAFKGNVFFDQTGI